jgi:hypothetical protein
MASPHFNDGKRSRYMDSLPEPGSQKTTVTIPKEDRELASHSLELTLTLDHLGSIRDRVDALLHTKKVSEERQWRETCHMVATETNCTGAAETALLKLPSTVPEASIRKLLAGLLETTDSLLGAEAGTDEASETLMVFCDQVRHCMH